MHASGGEMPCRRPRGLDCYCGGPLASWTGVVCCVPLLSRYCTWTVLPGRLVSSTSVSDRPAVTACPSSEVIVSPAVSPARAAAPPGSTVVISAPLLSPATPTPRKAVAPTWTVLDEVPASIWLAMLVASSIGIAYPCPVPDCTPPNRPALPADPALPAEPAVFIPMTCPELSTSGPPESPATTDWSTAVTDPVAYDGVPPAPPALPTAATLSPTWTAEELPSVTVASPDAPASCSTATSCVRS